MTATRPSDDIPTEWASNAIFVAGDTIGQPTKIEPSTAQKDDGDTPGIAYFGPHKNWITELIIRWLSYFDDSDQGGLFGDGSDGTVVLGVNTTLTRDTFYDNLDLAGFTLSPAGFRIFVKETFQMNSGLIEVDGTPGATSTGGGAGGAGTQQQTLGSSPAGGDGQTGAGDAGGASTNGVGGDGGDGGDGGGGGGSGGTGGLANAAGLQQGSLRYARAAIDGHIVGNGAITIVRGGAGGGGGGGDTIDVGGGGGGGGGVLMLAARTLTIDGTIRALGGAGGDGDQGNTAGGGGGGGGQIFLIYKSKTGPGFALVTKGTGGAGSGSGQTGDDGVDGSLIEIVV